MASRFGNFKEYYKFNEVDHRLDPLFASEVIDNWILDLRRMKMVTVIDLGCNAGDLTIQFYDQLTQRISNGIQNSNGEKGELEGGDLCGSHKRKRNEEECREPPKKTRESEGFGGDQKEELLLHQESLEKTEQPISKKEEKEGSCFVDDGCSDKILIPNESSLPSLSFLGIDLDSSLIKRAQQQVGSRNITFKTGNLMESDGQEIIQNFLKQNGVESFSLCLCFSITMWVHLNHGDVGLITFLTSLSSFSQNLVIEPQPWKCYKAAKKRSKRAGEGEPGIDYEILNGLKYRNDVPESIYKILTEKGWTLTKKIYKTKWMREIAWFSKRSNKSNSEEEI